MVFEGFLLRYSLRWVSVRCYRSDRENPIDAYAALFRGAFDGELRLGTTLAGFTPLLLTSIAFAVAAKAGAFNVGVEGEVFLGGITAAYIGINWTFLPKPALYVACFVGAMVVAAAWPLFRRFCVPIIM